MKKNIIAIITMLALVLAMGTMALAEDYSDINVKVALITMDSMSSHWVHVKEGVEDAVAKYAEQGGTIEMSWLAPEQKDNSQQIQKIEAAIADGVDFIVIAANDPSACNRALEEAKAAGIKLIYVDSPATVEAEVCYATNNYGGGVTAGEYLKACLDEAGITEGSIGIVDAQAGVQSCQDRYDGFASVFEGTGFVLSERQYSDGDEERIRYQRTFQEANDRVLASAECDTSDGVWSVELSLPVETTGTYIVRVLVTSPDGTSAGAKRFKIRKR